MKRSITITEPGITLKALSNLKGVSVERVEASVYRSKNDVEISDHAVIKYKYGEFSIAAIMSECSGFDFAGYLSNQPKNKIIKPKEIIFSGNVVDVSARYDLRLIKYNIVSAISIYTKDSFIGFVSEDFSSYMKIFIDSDEFVLACEEQGYVLG